MAPFSAPLVLKGCPWRAAAVPGNSCLLKGSCERLVSGTPRPAGDEGSAQSQDSGGPVWMPSPAPQLFAFTEQRTTEPRYLSQAYQRMHMIYEFLGEKKKRKPTTLRLPHKGALRRQQRAWP